MKTKDKIYTLHFENSEEMEKLFFYKDEIAIMRERIAEVAERNSSKSVLAEIEHFQNQLIIQDENVDRIKREISKNEMNLELNFKKRNIERDRRINEQHNEEMSMVSGFEKNFYELRVELKEFLMKWL